MMVRMNKRHISVGQQTWALLCKNFLKKWRMKRETLLEWLFSLLLALFAYLLSFDMYQNSDFPQMPAMDLGRVDNFNDSNYMIAFAPESKTTQAIMNKVASAPFMKGRTIVGRPDEKSMNELHFNYSVDVVRVIFNDNFSYHLKFSWGSRIPGMKEHRDHSAHCEMENEKVTCEASVFWERGFVAFQAAINAAIIEITTNHSVMEDLMSVTGINMKILPFVAQAGVKTDFSIFFCILSFSAFIYYMSVNVTQERQYMKSLMIVMGLQESAFWLSWGLMYGGFIFTMATLMALIVKHTHIVVLTGSVLVFTLFLLYGLSLITLAFLMSVLVKKPFLTGLVVFLLTVFWGSLGFTALYRHLPAFLEWTLCLLSPFAFTAGMAQLLHVDHDVNTNIHMDSSNNPNLIIATLFMLVFDTLLYLVLTLYFDKILPTEYGHRRTPWFFLKSSFWFQHQRTDHVALENEIDVDPSSNDSFEPVSPEFHGKEAIRIKNLKKEYKTGKHEKVEALKGLVFDIYEGQITALLGHSGAGKTTLLNMLSGLSVPTSGSVTIYNHSLSEMTNLETVSKLTGVCPQSNVQFGFLTVRENLRLFAKIKGIQPQEVEEEVQRILQDLEMDTVQDTVAQNLSGGQKRKLTFGIAILGDPQILLLDEPTAGSDPLSRHRVWNLLKERKSDRVILFSTQFMDEADILADRKVFISNGKLKCAGSSLFLKKKWGIGYHLSLHLNEMCEPDNVTSLVKQHIPDAKLTAQSDEKLVYTLPLERTNKFPDLYRDLDKCSKQGIEDYGVSMTTLNEVFLKLEGKSTVDDSDIGIWGQLQSDRTKDTEGLVELQQLLSSFNETKNAASGLALWRQQTCAIAKVRFLKLKNEKKTLMTILLLLGVSFCPQFLEHVFYELYKKSFSWGLSPNMYFLSPGQLPHAPLTHLLLINKTGSSIENFIHSLRKQNIALEVDAFGTRHGPNEPSYNGAITVSGDDKDHRFSIACNTRRLNCFPVLMDVISNGLLGLFNSSERIQTDRSTYIEEHLSDEYGYMSNVFFWIPVAACFTPYIAMGSISDYKVEPLAVQGLKSLSSKSQFTYHSPVVIYLSFQKPVIIASCLRKEYARKKKNCFAKRKKKVAIRNVSFCVKKGEVIGLLGHNGAGKSTTIKLITGDTKPTAGQVILKGSSGGAPLGFLGYCPQENALWPNLTVREHLEVFAAVKGLRKADAAIAITRLVDALKLQDQQKRPVKALSEGIKRKLCFALSILGNPSVVLLDEPSTGMDPEGQLQMWQAIRATFRNTERGALLTTHYMAEAEAVCDRVAIMASGRLRCIGSIQHLKSKFGKDYLLEMKVKTPTQVEPLHAEILRLFPQAARQDRYSSLMVYKLPVEDVRPLSQAFFRLELGKSHCLEIRLWETATFRSCLKPIT
ncbi:PREDICTED: ATP-binding cassette sub-family A member 9-like [Hipposideros armiger]|uniref:ATP-binding cassette sub-family A member 9-like n=1 Tax=Hipposideros armiger TaxID=186990 RepID=A0A8B7PSE8_HIPAR|nr:PREDICTED: ATP-binding cassette sub-family A member 9-like [Hipposideros armiger]